MRDPVYRIAGRVLATRLELVAYPSEVLEDGTVTGVTTRIRVRLTAYGSQVYVDVRSAEQLLNHLEDRAFVGALLGRDALYDTAYEMNDVEVDKLLTDVESLVAVAGDTLQGLWVRELCSGRSDVNLATHVWARTPSESVLWRNGAFLDPWATLNIRWRLRTRVVVANHTNMKEEVCRAFKEQNPEWLEGAEVLARHIRTLCEKAAAIKGATQ